VKNINMYVAKPHTPIIFAEYLSNMQDLKVLCPIFPYSSIAAISLLQVYLRNTSFATTGLPTA
jgi:hypothetical protein